MAGIHLADESAGTWHLPNLKDPLGDLDCIVITFAHWEEGFIVRQGNPKKIRTVSDIAKPTVKIVNREKGSGARRLLDKQMRASTISPKRIRGYSDEVFSHLDVASRIKAGLADTGIAVHPTSGNLLVCNETNHELLVLDGETLAIQAKVGVGQHPHSVMVGSDKRYAYVSNWGSRSVSILAVTIRETSAKS